MLNIHYRPASAHKPWKFNALVFRKLDYVSVAILISIEHSTLLQFTLNTISILVDISYLAKHFKPRPYCYLISFFSIHVLFEFRKAFMTTSILSKLKDLEGSVTSPANISRVLTIPTCYLAYASIY